MTTNERKGVTKEIATFLSWGKQAVLGYSTNELNGKQYVNKVWCKVCAKNKDTLNVRLKGAAKKSADAFTNGTNVVTKFNVSYFLKLFLFNN